MARGRPVKKGLDWFKKDVNWYEDFKIMDLMNEYGPVGSVIYDCLLCMIYREGYYIEVPLDKLCLAVIRAIGSKWLAAKETVGQVIHYCAQIGLFDRSLLERNVLTSAGIQRRYADVTSRNKVDKSMYWLLDDDPGEDAPEERISAAENAFFDAVSPQEKEKEKDKDKEKEIRNKKERAAGAAAPSLDAVKAYCTENGLRVDPERFWNTYEAVGWVMRGDPIQNWKAVLDNWEKTERPQCAEREPVHKPSYDLDEYERYDIFSQMPPGSAGKILG